MLPPGDERQESKCRITSACCRTSFPLRSKLAANAGVMGRTSAKEE